MITIGFHCREVKQRVFSDSRAWIPAISFRDPDKRVEEVFTIFERLDLSREEEKGRNLLGKMAGALEEGLMTEEMIEDYHTCLRPVSADDVPLIGQTKLANLYLNTGHGSKGWTYSWGSAVLLAQVSLAPASSSHLQSYI